MANTVQLEELGFTKSEAQIYLALLEQGPIQAGIISKKTRLNRTSTYQILDRLIHKGIVSFIQRGKHRTFQALAPEKLIEIEEEKTRLAKTIVPELKQLAKPTQEQATIYLGRRGVKIIMSEVLQSKEYVSFGSGGQFYDIMKHDFQIFQKEKKRRNIKSRVIVGKSSRNKPIVQDAHAQFRFVEDRYMTPTTTWVYQDNVAIVAWSTTPIVTLIKNKEVAAAYTAYFELLWRGARK